MIPSTSPHAETTHRLSWITGLGCGLLFGLASGLTFWGHDAQVLARSSAELAWAKLEIGLPLVVLISVVTGALAGRSTKAGTWVGAWMVSGVLVGLIVGGMPFASYNLATWIAEPRLRGVNVYPMEPAGVARMIFVAITTGCTWSAAGLVSHLLVEQARGAASRTGRTERRSWMALLLCLPMALPAGLIGDDITNRPLRTGLQAVYETISSTGPRGDVSTGDASPYRDLFSPSAHYTLHLVGYRLETPAQETVDVAFDNGFVVRCQVSGRTLDDCAPASPHFEAWMDGLIQETLQGEPGAELAPQAERVSVSAATREWLASQREVMGERYAIARDAQRGGWVIMSARFDTGYVLTCYFYGTPSVVLDHCSGAP